MFLHHPHPFPPPSQKKKKQNKLTTFFAVTTGTTFHMYMYALEQPVALGDQIRADWIQNSGLNVVHYTCQHIVYNGNCYNVIG